MENKVKDFMNSYFYPLALILTVGLGSWYIGNREDTIRTDARLEAIEVKIEVLTEVVDILKDIKIELAKRGVWMEGVDKDLDSLKEGVSDRYTSQDAARDLSHITSKIEYLEMKIQRLEETRGR